MNTYIVYYINEDGTKEKLISPAADAFSAEQIILRAQPLKIIVTTVSESDEQPSDSEDYQLID